MTFNVNSAIEQEVQDKLVVRRSADQLLIVALISLINTILLFFGVHVEFLIRLWGGIGLAITEQVALLAHRVGGIGSLAALIINGFLSGMLIVFWNFARKGNKWAFWAGAALYALDALWILLSWERPYVNLAFHALVLFFLLGGVSAISRLRRLEQTS